MARPLPAPTKLRGGSNGATNGRPSAAALLHEEAPEAPAEAAPEAVEALERLHDENAQLRALCLELEQALHEATQNAAAGSDEERLTEYEALLEEKTEVIRQLHEQLEQVQAEAGSHPAPRAPSGPAPREDDLLALSEELERERRQLQEDEQALMQQMREMEVSMARERAEMARQRNDMQRLQGEVRHEIDRLERSGALQSKIDGLKSKFQDATSRRGSAPGVPLSQIPPPSAAPAAPTPARKDSILGRFFGGK